MSQTMTLSNLVSNLPILVTKIPPLHLISNLPIIEHNTTILEANHT